MRDNCRHEELTWRDKTILTRPLDHIGDNARAYRAIAYTTLAGGIIGYLCDSPLIGAGIGTALSSALAIIANKSN